MSRKFLPQLAFTGALTAAAAIAGSVATRAGLDDYDKLDKPDFTPPSEVFPIAWTTLYADIAATTAHALKKARTEKERRRLVGELVFNLGLNAGWSMAFFGGKRRWTATGVAVSLTASSVSLARQVGKQEPAAGCALAPYPAWCAFATVLCASVAARND